MTGVVNEGDHPGYPARNTDCQGKEADIGQQHALPDHQQLHDRISAAMSVTTCDRSRGE